MAEPSAGALVGGDYRLMRPLGAGGMGVVWVAEQLSTGTPRAIKLLRPELVEDQTQLGRFLNEARIGARIPSDHVVQVLGAGHDPALGAPWLAMELLEGVSLGAHLRAHERLEPADAYEVLTQLCHALGAGHARGIVHRDVKPENVFLAVPRREGARFTVKVLDFGIAKLLSGGQTTTAPMGSPVWMSPEQTEAHSSITPATDVWALGLLAFRVLTGKHYWLTPQQPGGSMPSLMREIVLGPIPPASARAAALGCAERLPPGFDAWFAKCVCREVPSRFPDASTAKQALDAVLAVWEPVRAGATGPFPFGEIQHHTVGFALVSGEAAALPTHPIGPARPPSAVDQYGTSVPVTFGTSAPVASDPRFSATEWAPRPARPSRLPLVLAVLGGGGLLALAAIGIVAWQLLGSSSAASAAGPGLPSSPYDTVAKSVSVSAGAKEPGTFVAGYALTEMSQSVGLTFAEAGDRCRAKDEYSSGFSLCSPAQWRVACRQNTKIGATESWLGSLVSESEALVCGGNGNCESCRKVAVDDKSAARSGPCCTPAPLIRNKNPSRELAPAEAIGLTMLHNNRYTPSPPMGFSYFAPSVDWYDSKGLSPEATKELIRTTQSRHPNDWSVDEECTATEGSGPIVLTHDCRRTVRSGKDILAVMTRIEYQRLAPGADPLALRSIRDTAVLFRMKR